MLNLALGLVGLIDIHLALLPQKYTMYILQIYQKCDLLQVSVFLLPLHLLLQLPLKLQDTE